MCAHLPQLSSYGLGGFPAGRETVASVTAAMLNYQVSHHCCMTSAARRKVDSQTMQLFDAEVDKPEHDQVMTRLFQDPDAIHRLLLELHGGALLKPIVDSDVFVLETFDGHSTIRTKIPYSEAVAMSGVAPVWTSLSPIRLSKKGLECLLDHYAEGARVARLIGFIDMVVEYKLIKGLPMLTRNSGVSGPAEWALNAETRVAAIEVKGSWPTAGNLIRQLNLYRCSVTRGYFNGRRTNFVVGPDDSMADLIHEHGYRLVTFDATGTQFKLLPLTPAASELGKSPF